MHVACANGCIKIVDLLLRNGAKINVRDKYGSRPIDVAAAKHHVEIVKLLETFGSMQQMLKGLQEGNDAVGRRSVDASLFPYEESSRAQRLRRPSLPCAFDAKNSKLDIPPVPSLPPPRHSINTLRPSADELLPPIDISRYPPPRSLYRVRTPELASSKSSDGSDDTFGTPPNSETDMEQCNKLDTRRDWYSYGVVNHFEDENYLTSLERRAFGFTSPTATTPISEDIPDSSLLRQDPMVVGRASLDNVRPVRPLLESTPLKRCSSDGGHLRTTALMNAMAANNMMQDDEQEPQPRPSLYEDRPDADILKQYQMDKEGKKSWWNPLNGNGGSRKTSIDYPTGRPSLESNPRRSSLDFRPSLDGLSQLAKKSMEGLSRKSLDISDDIFQDDDLYKKNRGFLSRWVGTWSGPKK